MEGVGTDGGRGEWVLYLTPTLWFTDVSKGWTVPEAPEQGSQDNTVGSAHPLGTWRWEEKSLFVIYFSFAELGSGCTCTIELLVAILQYLDKHIIA